MILLKQYENDCVILFFLSTSAHRRNAGAGEWARTSGRASFHLYCIWASLMSEKPSCLFQISAASKVKNKRNKTELCLRHRAKYGRHRGGERTKGTKKQLKTSRLSSSILVLCVFFHWNIRPISVYLRVRSLEVEPEERERRTCTGCS